MACVLLRLELRLAGLQFLGLFPGTAPAAKVSRLTWAISALLRLSKSISDGVSILGAGEVPSFRLSEAVEGVAEALLPPLFEAVGVSLPEFIELLL